MGNVTACVGKSQKINLVEQSCANGDLSKNATFRTHEEVKVSKRRRTKRGKWKRLRKLLAFRSRKKVPIRCFGVAYAREAVVLQ